MLLSIVQMSNVMRVLVKKKDSCNFWLGLKGPVGLGEDSEHCSAFWVNGEKSHKCKVF